jgi:uncharacterized SAM-binding protein YcdF (DUF218 family)
MRRLGRGLLAVAAIAAACAIAYGPALNAAGHYLVAEDPLARADVIVVLSGGRRDERVRQAAELHRAGYAPVVLLSGGEATLGIPTTAILERQALIHGIPREALLFERESTSTADQARLLRPLLEARGVRRALVVTSSYHSRRTRYLFGKLFAGSPVDIRIYPVQDDLFHPERWWTREQDTESLVLEYIKLAVSVARYR